MLTMREIEVTGQVIAQPVPPRDNGWTVLQLQSPEHGIVSASGVLPEVHVGADVHLVGKWQYFRGKPQLKFQSGRVVIRRTRDGICSWLKTIKGIGPKLSQAIYDHFAIEVGDDGEEVWKILRGSPERVTEVPRIGRIGEDIGALIREHALSGELHTWLMSAGLSLAYTKRILELFGDQTVTILTSNPYELVKVRGIGFKKADMVARHFEIPENSPFRLRAGVLHVLEEQSRLGHCCLPQGKLTEHSMDLLRTNNFQIGPDHVEEAVSDLCADGDVVHEEGAFYLRPLYEAERGVANVLARMMQQPTRPGVQPQLLEHYAKVTGIQLHDSQVEALDRSLKNPVSIITGGPGTGKTTLTRALVMMLEARDATIALCAPTGKAARRLAEATGKEAYTIHRLIGLKSDEDDDERYIESDVVVVDEASMVDIWLMYSLCRRLRSKAQLVMVGDVDQLPSVGPGKVLEDLIDSGGVPSTRLTEVQRQAAGSMIVAGAHCINSGRLPATCGLGDLKSGGLAFVQTEGVGEVLDRLARIFGNRGNGRPLTDIGLLSSQRVGPIGVAAFNDHLQSMLNRDGRPIRDGHWLRFGDRVVHTRNNYRIEVFNGEVGWLREPTEEQRQREKPVMALVDYGEERLVPYIEDDLEDLQLAYCMTVHKAQGSEYPVCIVICHSSHYFINRRLLYTAVTRGREMVVILGNDRGLTKAVENWRTQGRWTGLAHAMTSVAQ